VRVNIAASSSERTTAGKSDDRADLADGGADFHSTAGAFARLRGGKAGAQDYEDCRWTCAGAFTRADTPLAAPFEPTR
jgi:hypothetical protein